MAVIAFVRHGETEWNRLGKIQGKSDIPLNAIGLEQAQKFAQRITTEFSTPWHHIYSSPLDRARTTAKALADILGYEIGSLDGIRERDYGAGEGLTTQEVSSRYGDNVPGKETVEEVRFRGINTVFDLAESHRQDNVVVVSHGGTMRAIFQAITADGFPLSGESIKNTGIHLIEHENDEFWVDGFARIHKEELTQLIQISDLLDRV